MIEFIVNLSRNKKIFISIIFDIVTALISVWIAFSLRKDGFYIIDYNAYLAFLFSLLFLPIFYFFSVYHSVLRYTGLITLKKIFIAITIYGLIYFLILFTIFIIQISIL